MSSKKEPSPRNNNSSPSYSYSKDYFLIQTTVTATLAAAMAILNPGKSSGPGSVVYSQNHKNNQEHQNENNQKKKKVFWKKRKSQSSQGPSKKLKNVAAQVATNPVTVPVVQTTTVPVAVPTAPTPTTKYAGSLPWCDKCKYHHYASGPCINKICNKCGMKGHFARNCKTPSRIIGQASGSNTVRACYNCGEIGHFKRNCPKATTPNNVNNAGMVLALKQEETAANSSNVAGIFLFDNPCPRILFEFGVKKILLTTHSFIC